MNLTAAIRHRVIELIAGRSALRTKAVSLRDSFSSFAFPPFGGSAALNSLQVTAVYACIDALSKDVAKLPIIIYKNLPDGGREPDPNHPLAVLFRRPNSWMTRFDFFRYLMAAVAMSGNSYNVVIRPGGELLRIIPIYPYRVRILLSVEGEIFYEVSRNSGFETAQLGPAPLYIPARDVLHVKALSLDGFRGMSPLEVARNAIEMSQSMERHATNLFNRGARPGGVLEAPTALSDKSITNIKTSWEEAVGGLNSGGIAVLEEGVKYNPLGINSVDAQFIENRNMQVEEIARTFGVPLHRIGSLSRATWNNVENLSRDYVDNTLLPHLENIESALETVFDLAPQYSVEFDVSRLLRADQQARFVTYGIARQWGILNGNEIRAKEGANKVPGGEVYFAPLNMTDQRMIGKQPLALPPPGGTTEEKPTPSGTDVPTPEGSNVSGDGIAAALSNTEAYDLVDLVSRGVL